MSLKSYRLTIYPIMVIAGFLAGAGLFHIAEKENCRAHDLRIASDRLCPDMEWSPEGSAAEVLSKQLCGGHSDGRKDR